MRVKVEAIGLGKRYPGRRGGDEVVALRDFTLQVFDGEFLAVVGPSGCGKSTFLNAVAGLERIDEGRLLMDGAPITKAGADRGVCFQDFALFPWMTVRENVEFSLEAQGRPRAERRGIGAKFIELVQLRGFENRYPYELSGGMKQRCALARLVAGDPAIFLMDEPLAALDAQTRLILQNEILRIWGEARPAGQRKTVIFITHSIDEAVFLADRIAVMTSRPGQIKEIVVNALPRPREDRLRGEAAFSRLTMDIWELVRDAAVKAIET